MQNISVLPNYEHPVVSLCSCFSRELPEVLWHSH